MENNNEVNRTPTPWQVVTYEHRIFGETTFDYGIISPISEIPICNLDPTYNDTLTSEVCKENAEFICKAVNEYDKLKEDNAALLNALRRIDAISFQKNEWKDFKEINNICVHTLQQIKNK